MAEAVDSFLRRGLFHRGASVPVLSFAVHAEFPDVIAGDFNAQDKAELIIHIPILGKWKQAAMNMMKMETVPRWRREPAMDLNGKRILMTSWTVY